MADDTVEARFAPAHCYSILLVPVWVRDPTVIPLRSLHDELVIKVSRRFSEEQWRILPMGDRQETLAAFRLLGGGKTLGDPRDVDMTIYLPPDISDFKVFYVQ